ncbi:MAG: sensor histidine kinase [Acidobacteriia bacterium]|nr:sensor histidine kinase [Terriglobia bacterium]
MRNAIWQNTKVILVLAFGSLLLIITILGIGAYRRSDRIYRDVTFIQDAYQQRTVVLNDIQSDIYLSAILIRDYLLDPAVVTGAEHRRQLLETRQSLEKRLKSLEQLATLQDREALQQLGRKLEGYWDVMDPVFDWTPERKAAGSFSFLRKQVLPRRTAVLEMTQRINEIDAASLKQEQQRTAASWEAYRKYLKLLFAYALSLALFTAVMSIYRLSTLEKRADEHRMRLAEAEQGLRLLSQRLVHAQEEERRSLSRELHDEIGQMLTGIRMVFINLEQLGSAPEPGYGGQLAEGKGLTDRTMQMVRNLALGLRPSMLDDLGLVPALEWQAREFSRRSGTPVELKTDGSLESIPDEVSTCIYRIVQESLTNCARHSRANTVRIDLHGGVTELSLTVRDDGVGFDAQQIKSQGFGLIGIRERIRELAGTVTVDSQPSKGTVLKAVIPLKMEVSA